jgi:hypothetical protein
MPRFFGNFLTLRFGEFYYFAPIYLVLCNLFFAPLYFGLSKVNTMSTTPLYSIRFTIIEVLALQTTSVIQ